MLRNEKGEIVNIPESAEVKIIQKWNMRLKHWERGDISAVKVHSRHKFHPIKPLSHDPFQNLTLPPSYNVPLTLIAENEAEGDNITVNVPTMLAEDANPRLDNDIVPAWLFIEHFGISFHPHHAEFIPYPIICPWAVSVPRLKHGKMGTDDGYRKVPFIPVNVNGRPIEMLLDSCGSADMISHKSAKLCGLHNFTKAEIFPTTDSQGPLILQGYQNVPVQVPGLPSIFTKVYETIPNGIHNDTIDGLTTKLFTKNGYIVTVTDNEVLFENGRSHYLDYGSFPLFLVVVFETCLATPLEICFINLASASASIEQLSAGAPASATTTCLFSA